MAKSKNMQMFQHIKKEAKNATQILAMERGEAPDALGYGVRNVHLLAVAPMLAVVLSAAILLLASSHTGLTHLSKKRKAVQACLKTST